MLYITCAAPTYLEMPTPFSRRPSLPLDSLRSRVQQMHNITKTEMTSPSVDGLTNP